MHSHAPGRAVLTWSALALTLLVLGGCAAGSGSEWSAEAAEPAGFWAGLWHGALLLVALFVSFFSDTVSIYEAHNTGLGYEIGFVLGVLIVYGGSSRVQVTAKKKARAERARVEVESWEEIASGVEAKVKAKISAWVEMEEESGTDEEWREIGAKVEQRFKEKIRRWVEEEESRRGAGGPPE